MRTAADPPKGSQVHIWDTRTGELLHSPRAATVRTLALAFDASGETLATGGEDNRIQLWNVADMRLREVLAGHGNWILSLAFSPDGKQLRQRQRQPHGSALGYRREQAFASVCRARRLGSICGLYARRACSGDRKR